MDVTWMFLLVALGHSVSSLQLIGSSVHEVRLGSDARIPFLITVEKPPVDLNHLTIAWQFQNKEILIYNKIVRITSPRYSLSTEDLPTGIVVLIITNVQVSDGGRYKSIVIYGSERKEKDVWLDIGAPPQVAITEKTVVVNVVSVLRCSATGFFPPDIGIKWFQDGEKLEDNIIVNDLWRNPDRTFSVNNTVTITPTEEDRKRIFSCRVQHKSLQEPLYTDFRLVYEDRISAGIIAACSVPVVILIIIIAAVLWWKRKSRRKVIAPFTVGDIEVPPRLIDGEEAALSCTVDNAPEDLTVTWLIRRDGREQEIQTSQTGGQSEEAESLLDTSYVIKSQREGHQYLSSLIFIPHMERHKDVTFLCRGVYGHHKAEKTFHCKTIYVMGPLIVGDIAGPPKLIDGEATTLCCRVYNALKDLTVTWLMSRDGREQEIHTFQMGGQSEEEVESLLDTSYVIKSQREGRQYLLSLSFIPQKERHKDVTFICRGVSGQQKDENTFPCEMIYGKPQMAAPIEITMADSSHVRFSLKLQEFYPKDINISWHREDKSGEYRLSSVETINTRDNHLTYEVTSVLRVPDSLFRDPEMKIIVKWKHANMETSETRSLSVRDLPWHPHVGSINVPRLEDGKEATLTCDISRYFPDLLSVHWLTKKDGNETTLPKKPSNEDRTSKTSFNEKREEDNTYSCEASVTFTPILSSDEGSEILCRVEHPSEEGPIERSTGPLHIVEKN